MGKTELEELAERIQYRYGDGRHYEIIKAEKILDSRGNGCGWDLVINTIEEDTEKVAENESDK